MKIINKKILLLLTFTLLQSFSNNLAHAVTISKMLSIQAPKWMNGTYFATMSLGAFILLPLLGKKSDQIGRKKIFLISTGFYALSQFLFWIDPNPYRIHIWRFIGGFGGVQMSMVVLMVSDNILMKNVKIIMIWYTLMLNIGEGLGKFVGGQLGNNNFSLTFSFQIIMQIILFMLILIFYKNKDKFDLNKKKENELKNKNKFNLKHILFWFAIVILLTYYVKTTFNNSITIYGQTILHYMPSQISQYMLIISAVSIFSLLVLSPFITKYININFAMSSYLFIGTIIWILVYFVNNSQINILLSLVYVCSSILFESAINSFIIYNSSKSGKGMILGIMNSFKFLGNMLGASISGFLFEQSPKLPYLSSSILLLIATIIFVLKYVIKPNKK